MKKERSYNLPLITFILALLGAALSVVALYEHSKVQYSAKFGVKLPSSFCNIGASFNCEAINQSAWSYFLGLPIATWGIWFYFVLMAFALLAKDSSRIKKEDSNAIFWVISIFTVLFSLYLFVISKVVIKTLCVVCVGLYVVNLVFLVSAFLSNPEKLPAFARIKRGFRLLISAPRALIGPDSGVAYLVLLYAGIAFVVACTLAEYLFLAIALPQAGKHGVEQAVKKWQAEKQQEIPLQLDDSPMADYFKGDLRAPITIVEYADFECPACQRFYFELSDVLAKHKKDVLFVYRNYPLSNVCNAGMPALGHANACYAAELSRCAGEQGSYWEMADYLFSLGTDPGLKGAGSDKIKAAMDKGVEQLSLDRTAIDSCVSSKRHAPKIQSDIASGDKMGLRGTPSIWINGRAVKEPNIELIDAIIQTLLKKK